MILSGVGREDGPAVSESPPDDEADEQPRQRGRPRTAEVRTTEADRREAIRAKNRRAQAAYRSRQKSQQDDVRSSIDHVQGLVEEAKKARQDKRVTTRQMKQRVAEASTVLQELQELQESTDPQARQDPLPLPPTPDTLLSMDDLHLPGALPGAAGAALCQAVQNMLSQQAGGSMQKSDLEKLAATTGFAVRSLPGSVRVVEFSSSKYSLLDHMFLFIHQGVHIHCLLARLQDARARLAACGAEAPRVELSGPYIRRPEQAQKSVWNFSNRQPPTSTAWLTADPPPGTSEPLQPRLQCQDLVTHPADSAPHLQPRPCMCHNLAGLVRTHALHMQDGAVQALQRFVGRLLDILGSTSGRGGGAKASREMLTNLAVDLRLASDTLSNLREVVAAEERKCTVCKALTLDATSAREEILRLHSALCACMQEFCVVRCMVHTLNPALQFEVSDMASCLKDLTVLEEVTLQADVYQALALTQPQAHTLRTLEAGYRMDRAHLQQGMVDSLAVSSKAQHGVPEELRAEALRTGGGLQAGSGHGTVCYAAAAPAGSHSTSPPRTAPCSIDAAGTTVSLPRSKRQSTDTGVAAGLGARSRRQSTGASAPLPPELLPAALSHELEPAATPRAREMHRRSSEGAPRGAYMHRRGSAVGTGIDDGYMKQLMQLVHGRPGATTPEQPRWLGQIKQDQQRSMMPVPQAQVEITPLASDLKRLSRLVQPPPQPHELWGPTFELPQGLPPGTKRPRSSMGFPAAAEAAAEATGSAPPKSPRRQASIPSTARYPQTVESCRVALTDVVDPEALQALPAALEPAQRPNCDFLEDLQRQLALVESRLLCGLLLDVCCPAQAGVLLTRGFPYSISVSALLKLLKMEDLRRN